MMNGLSIGLRLTIHCPALLSIRQLLQLLSMGRITQSVYISRMMAHLKIVVM
ncbi:hypothetical protein BMETH_2683_0 [methanotrophic bacterial endosymbiont of Bathymodiolus sp.]|nr:hypothetical protein BMETH_2683_0 [methanotrophic bacterial endosymbiont of Bathymodiolus sp.]